MQLLSSDAIKANSGGPTTAPEKASEVCTAATAAVSPGGERWANSACEVPFQLITTAP